jgi:hypothetical protein
MIEPSSAFWAFKHLNIIKPEYPCLKGLKFTLVPTVGAFSQAISPLFIIIESALNYFAYYGGSPGSNYFY